MTIYEIQIYIFNIYSVSINIFAFHVFVNIPSAIDFYFLTNVIRKYTWYSHSSYMTWNLFCGLINILENVPCGFETNSAYSVVGLKIPYISVRLILSKASYKSVLSLMIFSLDDSPIVENGVFQSPIIIPLCWFLSSYLLILAILFLYCVHIYLFIISYWSFLCLVTHFVLKHIFSYIRLVFPAILRQSFAWNLFWNPFSFNLCVSLEIKSVSYTQHSDGSWYFRILSI